MKKDNLKLKIIVIGIVIFSLFYFINLSEKESQLNVHYYKDGVEVFSQENSLSIITPPGQSFDQISFDIIGENLGNYPIENIQVSDAGPIQFKNAIPSLSKSLNPKETKILWISDRMDAVQFESFSQPVKFWINISGDSPYISDKIYNYMDLDISFEQISCLTLVENAINVEEIFIDEFGCQHWNYDILISSAYYTCAVGTICRNYYGSSECSPYGFCYEPYGCFPYVCYSPKAPQYWAYHPATYNHYDDYGGIE